VVGPGERNPAYIVPSVFHPDVTRVVASASSGPRRDLRAVTGEPPFVVRVDDRTDAERRHPR